MVVSFFGLRIAASATKTSGTAFGSLARKAMAEPSFETLALERTLASDGARRVIIFVAGSSRYRYDHVCCAAANNNPFGFQATIDGFSSNDAVKTAGMPPAAGTVAITAFV